MEVTPPPFLLTPNMYDFRFQKVMYRATSLKKAHQQFERDIPIWMAQGYAPHSQQWMEEKRGCLMAFLLLGVQKHGQLWVTYEKVRDNDVAQPDTANYTAGVGQAHKAHDAAVHWTDPSGRSW